MSDTKKPPRAPRFMPSRRVTIAMLAVLLLACGIVIGSGMTLLLVKKRVVAAIEDPQSRAKPILMRRLDRELSLTDEQYAQVDTIVGDHLHTLRDIRVRVWPEVVGANDNFRKSVGAVLNEEQRAKFYTRFDEVRSMFAPKTGPHEHAVPAE